MNIYDRLTEDHGKQRGLVGGLTDTTGDSKERRRLYQLLKEELEAHASAEEQAFYGPLMEYERGQPRARHSVAEHKTLADILSELDETDMSSGAWLTKAKHLQHKLIHHLDEEEDEVFVLAKKIIPEDDALTLGEKFDELKRDKLKNIERLEALEAAAED